jgi:hypothetical protein
MIPKEQVPVMIRDGNRFSDDREIPKSGNRISDKIMRQGEESL